MGPGPSMVPDEVYAAMGRPLLGHLDPLFVGLMDETKEMLRRVFLTRNEMTFPVSGTGTAGMECCMANLVEPGDEVLVVVNGAFGARMAEIAARCGGVVTRIDVPWGSVVRPEQVEEAMRGRSVAILGIVHAETSTGALTPLEEIIRIAHDAGALVVVDAVTSLGGSPLYVDDWGIDAIYSGTQKCLAAPPGLAPVSFGTAAVAKAARRKSPVQSWYFDVNLLAGYWGSNRSYHHTAPISMNYALHEALRLVLQEGLETRWERHRVNHNALVRGLEAMGLHLAAEEGCRLWQLNAVTVPEGIDETDLRRRLLEEENIEIGGGLGPLKGKTLRIGLMGATSNVANVERFLTALGRVLGDYNNSFSSLDMGAILSMVHTSEQ